MQRSSIEIANEVVSISYVCNAIGMGIPDLDVMSGRSYKTYCPFGDLYHPDQGTSKALRVYPDSNSAWCFACSEYFSPVGLYAKHFGITRLTDAAEQLLQLVGHASPRADARWEAAVAGPPQVIDPAALAEALKTYCARVCPDWTVRQFETPWSEWLDRCLGLLPMVHTADEAAQWLTATKAVMERELKGHHGAV